MTGSTSPNRPSSRGFRRIASLTSPKVRAAGEGRGFAVSEVLTNWPEIAGPEIAAIARPVRVSYGRGGFGATLTVLTTGAHAPMVEMQKMRIRDRVNGCYGYAAIRHVRVTQTAPDGFAEGQVAFTYREAQAAAPPRPDPASAARAREAAAPIRDGALRDALETLGRNVLARARRQQEKEQQ